MAGTRDQKGLEQLERFRRRTGLPAQRAEEGGWPQGNPSSALEQLRRAAEVADLLVLLLEARVAEIQQWLDSVHDVIVEEFGPNLLEEGPGERGRPSLLPPRPQSS